MIGPRHLLGRISNIHMKGPRADIFIFATPRSGSTFLMELLNSQPGVKFFNEPLNLNYKITRRELGIYDWETLTVLEKREEVFGRFFHRLSKNKIPDRNRAFFRPEARFITKRNVFKVLHGGEDMIPWFEEEFQAKIIILIRHPIPTALSHRHFPRLPYLLNQPSFARAFTADQQRFSRSIIDNGTHLERGILNWSLQNVHALKFQRKESWAIVSYEDLTVHPYDATAYLTEKVDLEPFDDLDALISKPSNSTVQSDRETRTFFESQEGQKDRRFLIEKWRKMITKAEETRAFEILDAFGLDCYEFASNFPTAAYRVPQARASTCSELSA